MKHIILHYHIFKNAGTSFDRILQRIFGEQFATYDKNNPGATIAPSEINEILGRYPTLKAFSSHQIKSPKPKLDGYIPHQVIFLRHPLARVASCFQFEKYKQKRYAEDTSLEDYVKRHLDAKNLSAIIGIQTRVIADNFLFKDRGGKAGLDEKAIQSAVRNLEHCKTFGIVEDFAKSLDLFENYFSSIFPEFRIEESEKGKRLNVSQTSHSRLDDAIESLRGQLHQETYNRLVEQLGTDLFIYEKAAEIFSKRVARLDQDDLIKPPIPPNVDSD